MAFFYDPFSHEAMNNPMELYRTLRDEHPVYYMPEWDTFAISRFQDVWDILSDAGGAFVGVEGTVPTPETLRRHNPDAVTPPAREPLAAFVRYPSPTYEQVRRPQGKPLRPQAVASLEDQIRTLARRELDELLPRGRFDLTRDFAGIVSASVMCHMLGIPVSEAPLVLETVNRATLSEPQQGGVDPKTIYEECISILLPAVARCRSTRGQQQPIVEGLIDFEIDGRPLTDQEIAAQLIIILVGGTETVPKIVAHGLWELREHSDQLAQVRADLAANISMAREEMIRYCAPAQWFLRTAARAADVAGQEIRPGQRVMLLMGSAARDEREFEYPDEFRWNRKIHRTLSFGRGQRFCMGVHLARLEISIMVEEFLSRVADYEIDTSSATRLPSSFQWGWNSIPVAVA